MPDLADNVRAFLEQVRFAVIATTNADGTPHQTALWYELRGDTVLMSTGSNSRKVRNIKRNAWASVCVVDATEARHVTLEGTIAIDDSHSLEDLTSVTARYVGKEAAANVAASINKNPHISLVLTIERVFTFGKI